MTFIALVPPPLYNVKSYGAVGDGTTSDTAAIAALAATLSSGNGGVIFFPPGTYRCHLPLYSTVHYWGSGERATIIKLEDSQNLDVFTGTVNGYAGGVMVNLAAANAAGITGGLYGFSIKNLTIDGNKANQTGASYGIRCYGYGYTLENVSVHDCFSDGIYSDWNGGGVASPLIDDMDARLVNVKSHHNGGEGIKWAGPHDSHFLSVNSFSNGSHGIHIGPNATATQWEASHSYGPPSGALAWLIEGGYFQGADVEGEGSNVLNVAILAGECQWSGHIFGIVGNPTLQAQVGLQLGQQAGQTPFAGSAYQSGGVTTAAGATGCLITGIFSLNNGGSINFANEQNNFISCTCYQTSGSGMVGTPDGTTALVPFRVIGLTPDGSQGKGGAFILPVDAFSGFVVRDMSFNDICNINTHSGSRSFSFPNGTAVTGYSDAYSTVTYSLSADGAGSIISKGSLSVGQSASAASLASSGTITTSGVGVARVTTSGAVTGVILQAGTVAGQICTVVNESANSITFATSATSHVADGVSDIIAATSARRYVWDSGTSLWYKCV